jgi:hypothetical protein
MLNSVKRLMMVLAAGLMLALSGSYPASAHTAAKDGKISALLHIDPNDDAKAGQVNIIHIYFNDLDERFTMEGCDCRIKINQDKEVLLDKPLDTAAVKTGTTKVFLPQDNFSYDVVASGTPKTAGFFQPFKLVFDIDVGNPPANEPKAEDGPNLLIRLVEASIIVGIVGYIVWRKRIIRQ